MGDKNPIRTLDVANRERTRLHLFQFSIRDQASNWLERLPAGSIPTWEDLTTRFLAQLFLPGRIAKLCNDILMFQQHQGESLSEAWTQFKDLLQKVPHHGIDLWLQNAEESWALLEDLALYDNESWNDPRDFAKPVKAISLPQDVPRLVSNFMASQDARLSKFEADFKQQQSEMTNKIDTVLKAIIDQIMGTLPSDTVKNSKLNVNSTSPVSQKVFQKDKPFPKDHPQPVTEIRTQQPKEPEQTLKDEFKDLHLNLPVLEVLAHALMYNAILDKYVESLELGKNRSAFIQGEMPKKIEDPGLFTLPCRLGNSEPFDTLADLGACVNIIPLYLFKKLNIRLLEENDHVFGLADGTMSYPIGIVRDVEVHIGRIKLLTNFYVIDMKKDPETPLLVGRGFLATANAVIDYRKAKIAVGERITSSDGVGARTPYYARKDFLECHFPREWEIARDAKINPFKDVLVFRRMVKFLGVIPIKLKRNMWESKDLIKISINSDKPPKNGDRAWHVKIRLINPDGEEFTKTLQLVPTSRKLSEREDPREIIDLDHFYDT
ncbi:MAK10-like protein [Tanacetum coccineum]